MKKSQVGKTRRLCLCAALTVFLAAPVVFGQTINEDILKLLRVSGAEKLTQQVMETVMSQFRQMAPQVPPEVWSRVSQKINVNELVQMTVPIYAKHYTHDEIKQLIRFYESPIGRKMVQVTPAMTQETMAIGQKFGERVGAELMNELKAAGMGP